MRLVTIEDLRRPAEQLEALIKQAQGLADLFDEFIRQDSETYSYTVTDHGEATRAVGIHASEMSKCQRRLVYGIMGTPRKTDPKAIDPNMKLRFRTGTAIHHMLQSDFRRMAAWYTKRYQSQGYALSFTEELSVRPDLQQLAAEWNIHSSCDGCFTFWVWNTYSNTWEPYLRVGVEIKTSSAPTYESRRKPDHDHTEQTCLYQACLDLPLIWVLYYNKSNSNFTTPRAPWLFKFDEHLWKNELEKRFADSHQKASARVLPDRVIGKHCDWCPFAHECKPPSKRGSSGAPVVPSSMLARTRP